MKKISILVAIAIMASATFSCSKENSHVPLEERNASVVSTTVTKAYGDKTPKMAVYVETNDVNPVNAIDYYLSDGSRFFDIVELFAANVEADDNGDPCIAFNDKLAPVMADTTTYIKPIKDAGLKVLLTLLPNWDDVGLCTMTEEQAAKLAMIAHYVVDRYGLDGIGADDEYEGNNYTQVAGSYGNFIKSLRDELGTDKLITTFAYGHIGSSQIDEDAGSLIDFAYTNFTYNPLDTSIDIAGVTKEHWAPISISLSYSYSSTARSRMQNNAAAAASDGYGAIMFFNLPMYSTKNCIPAFTAVASGAFGKTTYVSGGNRARAAAGNKVTITYEDLPEEYQNL